MEDEQEQAAMCELGAQAHLDELMLAARPNRARNEALKMGILDLLKREGELAARDDADLEKSEIQFDKWRLIHKYLHANPYRDRLNAKRSTQWREAVEQIRGLRDQEFTDWVCLQIEVAGNIENGIHEMRPRKGGPTYLVMLEYVANRKRKALAVLHFARDGEKYGVYTVNAEWHAKTMEILERYGYIEKDEEGNRKYPTDPLARS